MSNQTFQSPFLKKVSFEPIAVDRTKYPFNVPIFIRNFEIAFRKPVTIFVGENGSGKSTLLEALATKIGFNLSSGNRNHAFQSTVSESGLAHFI